MEQVPRIVECRFQWVDIVEEEDSIAVGVEKS